MRGMRILLVVLVAAIGIYFLGTGITGHVISQSCCFGTECAQEYLCDAAEPHLEAPSSTDNMLVGVVFLVMAAIGLYAHRRNHH